MGPRAQRCRCISCTCLQARLLSDVACTFAALHSAPPPWQVLVWCTWAFIAALLLLLVLTYNLFPDYSGAIGAGCAQGCCMMGKRGMRRCCILRAGIRSPARMCRPQGLGGALQLPGHAVLLL